MTADVRDFAQRLRKIASEIESMSIACPTDSGAVITKTNYLTNLLPLQSESLYQDLTEPENPVIRSRCMRVGCDVEAVCEHASPENVYEPAATVSAINAALVSASNDGGGLVRPAAINVLAVADSPIEMQDCTILDMSNVGLVDLIGSNFTRAVEAVEKELFAVTNMSVDGNTANHYAVWSEDSRNYLVQNISSVSMDNNSIDLGDRSQNVTVRYCDLNPGRDEDGNSGTVRNQHGIVSSSVAAPGPSVASARFGMVYSHSHAYYSNKIVSTDGLAIDSHASNVESMGNYTYDCVFGHKYPHAQNVMVHHNLLGGHRASDLFIFRLYTANDWDYGYGGDGDNIFVFQNTFTDLTSASRIRADLAYGDSYFIKNEYELGANQPYFATVLEENVDATTVVANQDGSIYVFGEDTQLNVIGPSVEQLTNSALQACDHNEMIRLMNLPRDSDWFVNATDPLPQVEAY